MGTYVFGRRSAASLSTCNLSLVSVAHLALKQTPYDFGIIHGWRNEAQQNGMHAMGTSQFRWPDSKHNVMNGGKPMSRAFDFVPVGPTPGVAPWEDTHLFAVIAGVILSAGVELRVPLIWGGDWNRNASTRDQRLMDWGHIELA